MYNIKQVIVIRKDLNMRKGKMAAQAAHASIKFLADKLKEGNSIRWTEEQSEWLNGSFAKIVVSVDSEEELMQLYQETKQAGLTVSLIIDSGATEFHCVPTRTCIAIGPHESEAIDKFTSHLKLL